jgi:hypothetical protein
MAKPKQHYVIVTITEEQRKKLKKVCYEKDTKISILIREMIDKLA